MGDNTTCTSHSACHIKRCVAKIYKDKGQKTIVTMKNLDGMIKVDSFKFDQHKRRMDLARMIIERNFHLIGLIMNFLDIFAMV